VDASSSMVPTPPPSSPLPLESIPIFPSPPPTEHVEPSPEDFDTSWRRWREQVGEYGGEFVDSQEQLFYESPSTCEEAQEDKFEEADYGDEEVASLEDMLWSQECMHNVHTYTKIVHKFEKERKRKRGGEFMH
jgi:hypothetical protein